MRGQKRCFLTVVRTMVSFSGVFIFGPATLVPEVALSSQMGEMVESAGRYRRGSSLSRSVGQGNIRKGLGNIRAGRLSKNPPLVQTGYIQVIEGILALMAAAKSSGLALANQSHATQLGALPGGGGIPEGASSIPPGIGAQSEKSPGEPAANSGPEELSADLDPTDLDDPLTKRAFALLKEDFGLTQKRVLEELAKGSGYAALLTKLPKQNALTKKEFEFAIKQSRKSQIDLGDSNSSEGGGAGPAPPADSVDSPPVAAAVAAETAGSVLGRPLAPNMGKSLRDRIRESLDEESSDEEALSRDSDLSPDVKEALAAREAERAAQAERAGATVELNLFQVVSRKYRSRERFLRWGDVESP